MSHIWLNSFEQPFAYALDNNIITRGAWAATGIVVRWFVCLFVCHEYIYSPGYHSAAFTA